MAGDTSVPVLSLGTVRKVLDRFNGSLLLSIAKLNGLAVRLEHSGDEQSATDLRQIAGDLQKTFYLE